MPAFLSVPQDAYPEPPDGASAEGEEARIVPLRPNQDPGPPPPLPVTVLPTEIVIPPKPPLPEPVVETIVAEPIVVEPIVAEPIVADPIVAEPITTEQIEHPDPFAASVVL